jgi:hypothetical protein
MNKTSTRVINPPGGRSNNILSYDEAVPTKIPKENIKPISNIFGSAESENNNQKPINYKMKSNIFGSDENDAKNQANSKKRRGFDPITGKPYEEDEEEEEKNKEKLVEKNTNSNRQPPGGRSSKLW